MSFDANAFLAVFLVVSSSTAVRAQTIQIELVNGATGRVITSRSKLHVWVGTAPGSGTLIIPTDKHGVALLRLTHNDSEINVPECEGELADSQKLANKKPKATKEERAEFDRKYEGCFGFEVKNPIARYADTIMINTSPGDVSWKGTPSGVPYVPCWVNTKEIKYSWMGHTDFSTEDILRHGIVTANTCGKATATAVPGKLILFVRSPSLAEQWRQLVN